jgi:RNA polymerase sigma factor (TIGR02999 family)
MPGDQDDITRLLNEWRNGDRKAEATLFELLLPDLRKMAQRQFRGERGDHTLQPTALVNEAFLRLSRAKHLEWRDRKHFFAIAGRVMRRYLIDYARSRPGVEILAMEAVPEQLLAGKSHTDLALQIDVLLDDLDHENQQRCSVVELRFFLGMTDEEAADALDLSVHTLQREWYRARRWLFERLDAKQCNPQSSTSG